MAETSTFRGIIEFMGEIGIYDVILPFLLVFTIVFAILEKTEIFGKEKVGGEEVTKKNINAMVAFVVGFLVVASTRLVSIINETMANMVLLLVLVICFMILIGAFHTQGEFSLEKYPAFQWIFMIIMFLGIIGIFLNAIGWLEPMYEWIKSSWDSAMVGSIAMVAFIAGMIFLIVKSPSSGKKKEKD